MRHQNASKSTAGFTIIEVLIALAVIGIVLPSIGALVTSSVRHSRSIETRLIRFEVMRGTMAALPERHQLQLGQTSGETNGHMWRVAVRPFSLPDSQPNAPSDWVPLVVSVTVQSPTRGLMEISTVRLTRGPRG